MKNRKPIASKSEAYSIKGIHEFILADKNGKEIRRFKKVNTIVKVGRTEVGRILARLTMDSQGINYAALGTGSASITDLDTVMEVEGARKVRGSAQSSDDSFIVAFYFGPSDGNGTWTRYSTFIDGESGVDTGVMFTHAEISLTKSEGEGLTINSQYTIGV